MSIIQAILDFIFLLVLFVFIVLFCLGVSNGLGYLSGLYPYNVEVYQR